MVAYGVIARMNQHGQAEQPLAPDTGSFDLLSRVGQGDFFNTGTVAFRRAALFDDEVGSVPLLDDSTLWWLLASQGSVAFVTGDPLSEYRPPNVSSPSSL